MEPDYHLAEDNALTDQAWHKPQITTLVGENPRRTPVEGKSNVLYEAEGFNGRSSTGYRPSS